ncbi:MAG: hypothetical protein FWG03_02915 [Clostridiales bacterium]|nr:hypothetical protein [Clostridiales bacterium]
MKRLFVLILVVAVILMLASCKGGGLGDIVAGGGGGGDDPADPKTEDPSGSVDGPASKYAVNEGMLSYIGKTPEEISALLGDYEESTWFTGMIFRYGDLWFAFDGDSQIPTGALSFVACPATDLIEGLADEQDAADLDRFFGAEGVYDANGNNGNEWYFGGYIMYVYDGYLIDLGCSQDMVISGKDNTALLRLVPSGGDALSRIIPSVFEGIWEELGDADEDSQYFRSLSFNADGTVGFNTGFKDIATGAAESYEVYEGTYEVFLAGINGTSYDTIKFDLTLDWWIAELDGADDADIAYWEERQQIDGVYRIWEADGSLNLERLDGKALSDTGWRGTPITDHVFWLAPFG